MKNGVNAIRLTAKILQQLKELGFRFVLIKGYTPGRRTDHIELNHFILKPVIQLPEDPAQKEIYAPIDSDILLDWASSTEGVTAFIERDPSSVSLL